MPILHDRGSVSEIGHQLVDLVPKFLSWLISFIIICKFWLNDHHVLTPRHHGMIWLNSIFLMGQFIHAIRVTPVRINTCNALI